MGSYNRQHYSPVLANRWWAKDDHYISYSRCERTRKVRPNTAGKQEWGRARRLWSHNVELALGDLENPVALIYQAMLRGGAPAKHERVTWAQFLMSQSVRTPTFIRYEERAAQLLGLAGEPNHDRVGCEHCADLVYVTGRDWAVLVAHEDDFFVRTDNPVLLTGPLEREGTAIYYPLSPRLCFVALPLPAGSVAEPKAVDPVSLFPLAKGVAHMINFHCARHADETIILHPDHNGALSHDMFVEVLGVYPQPPFMLHNLHEARLDELLESVRSLQSVCDGREYPKWNADELEALALHLLVGFE